MEIIDLVVSLLILWFAWRVRGFFRGQTLFKVEGFGYTGVSSIAAAGTVVLLRQIASAVLPGRGDFLTRPFGGSAGTIFWFWIIVGVIAYVVWYVKEETGPAILRNRLVRPFFMAYGATVLLAAILYPVTPFWWVVALVCFLVYGLRMLMKGNIKVGVATLAVVALAALVFTPGFLTKAYWQRGVPEDAYSQAGRVPGAQSLYNHVFGDPTKHCPQCGGAPSGAQAKGQKLTFEITSDVSTVTLICADTKTCESPGVRRVAKVMAQSAANNAHRSVVLISTLNGKQIGNREVFKPVSTKSDQEYGAVSHDHCVLAHGAAGIELPDPSTGTLKCRPLAGHTGVNK